MDIQELAEKLQQDGINKGKQEADRLIAQAQEQAQEIIKKAQVEEKRILQEAEQKAKDLLLSTQHNMELAARDIMLQLQRNLSKIFQNIVTAQFEKPMHSEELLKSILANLLESYQKQAGSHTVKLELPANISHEFQNWLTTQGAKEIRLQSKLHGFCLSDRDGGQIEVTLESVQEALQPLVNQFVRELLQRK